jgi:hypothetical protein
LSPLELAEDRGRANFHSWHGVPGYGNPRSFSSESMLRVADGCTESQFLHVPEAVLVCSYDVAGTRCSDYRICVMHWSCGVAAYLRKCAKLTSGDAAYLPSICDA